MNNSLITVILLIFLLPATLAYTFTEPFTFQGDHAAIIKTGTASTVWWNAHNWDVRGDTAHNAVAADGRGHHIDIHRSTADVSDGSQENRLTIGGNGDPGVGVMHVDFESIVSARLRNPLFISEQNPGVVEFRTSNFVTSGHWWEVIIAPTDIVTAAEFTAVPNTQDLFAGNQGSGHRPAEDSINFIVIGKDDVPCHTGWGQSVGFTKSIGGTTSDTVAPRELQASPSEKEKLTAWRLEYYPDRIIAFADLDDNGIKEHFHTFNMSVPWEEVYVYLAAVAYQAVRHPQDGNCGAYQGQVREIPWKDVRIEPVKYSKTKVYPKEQGTDRLPLGTGWVGYDIRDTQRTGLPPVRSLQDPFARLMQPNRNSYDKHGSMAFCHETGAGWYNCNNPVSQKTLTFDLPAEDAVNITQAQLIYDIKKEGSAVLSVNGQRISELPRWTTVAYPQNNDPHQWVQRSQPINPSLFQVGTNTIRIDMFGNIGFDRLQLEFGYDTSELVQGNPVQNNNSNNNQNSSNRQDSNTTPPFSSNDNEASEDEEERSPEVRITRASLTPQTVSCDRSISLDIDLRIPSSLDEEDVEVEIINNRLGLLESLTGDDFTRETNGRYTTRIIQQLNADLQGSQLIEILVRYDQDIHDREFVTVNIEDCFSSTSSIAAENTEITAQRSTLAAPQLQSPHPTFTRTESLFLPLLLIIVLSIGIIVFVVTFGVMSFRK